MWRNTDYNSWSKEGYNIAITKYDGIVPDEALPQWYIDTNLVVTEEQITLAGYRMAYLMEYIFPSRNGFLQ